MQFKRLFSLVCCDFIKEKLQYFEIVTRQPFHYIIIVQPNRLEGFSVLLVATSGEFDSVSGFVEDQTWFLNCVAR